jgi:hypothetical protein
MQFIAALFTAAVTDAKTEYTNLQVSTKNHYASILHKNSLYSRRVFECKASMSSLNYYLICNKHAFQ